MQEYIEKYGAELVTKQLEIEAKYKFLGQEAVRTSYEKAKAEPDGVMRTSLGQKVLGNQFEQIKQGMGLFVDTCLNPHCGTKPAYTEIVARIDKLYGEAGRSELLDTLTLITFSACLNASLLRQSPISNICQTIASCWMRCSFRHTSTCCLIKKTAFIVALTSVYSHFTAGRMQVHAWSMTVLFSVCGIKSRACNLPLR